MYIALWQMYVALISEVWVATKQIIHRLFINLFKPWSLVLKNEWTSNLFTWGYPKRTMCTSFQVSLGMILLPVISYRYLWGRWHFTSWIMEVKQEEQISFEVKFLIFPCTLPLKYIIHLIRFQLKFRKKKKNV